jgi:hypothetical protein
MDYMIHKTLWYKTTSSNRSTPTILIFLQCIWVHILLYVRFLHFGSFVIVKYLGGGTPPLVYSDIGRDASGFGGTTSLFRLLDLITDKPKDYPMSPTMKPFPVRSLHRSIVLLKGYLQILR